MAAAHVPIDNVRSAPVVVEIGRRGGGLVVGIGIGAVALLPRVVPLPVPREVVVPLPSSVTVTVTVTTTTSITAGAVIARHRPGAVQNQQHVVGDGVVPVRQFGHPPAAAVRDGVAVDAADLGGRPLPAPGGGGGGSRKEGGRVEEERQ